MDNVKFLSLFEQGSFSGSNFAFSLLIALSYGSNDYVHYNNMLMIVLFVFGIGRNYISIPLTICKVVNKTVYLLLYIFLYSIILLAIFIISIFIPEIDFYGISFILTGYASYELTRRYIYRALEYRYIYFLSIFSILALIIAVVQVLIVNEKVDWVIQLYFMILASSIVIFFLLPKSNSKSTQVLTCYRESLPNSTWGFLSGVIYSSYNQFFYLYMNSQITTTSMSTLYLMRTLFQPVQVLISAFDSIDKVKIRSLMASNSSCRSYIKDSQRRLWVVSAGYMTMLIVGASIYSELITPVVFLSEDYIIFLFMAILYMLMAVSQPVESALIASFNSRSIFYFRLFGCLLMVSSVIMLDGIFVLFASILPWLVTFLCSSKKIARF